MILDTTNPNIVRLLDIVSLISVTLGYKPSVYNKDGIFWGTYDEFDGYVGLSNTGDTLLFDTSTVIPTVNMLALYGIAAMHGLSVVDTDADDTDEDELEEFYHEGGIAYQDGIPVEENPYDCDEEPDEFLSWAAGWKYTSKAGRSPLTAKQLGDIDDE